jgi:acylphosphatase
MAILRRTVIFTGRVQGVFFRATTREVAERFAVTGYVRNLPDGTVELVAEGESEVLDAFIAAVAEAKRDCIDNVESTDGVARAEFDAFTVRY